MCSIASYGVSIPKFQIENHILHPQLGKRKGKHSVIFSDEDVLTLTFDAASKCLGNIGQSDSIDAVLFASTTPVFKNRYHASFLAEQLDLPKGILALDFCASPRSGTDALLVANHLLNTEKYHNVLILAADTHFLPIGDELKIPFGHAGCALLLSKQEGIAEVKSAETYSSFITEEFVYKNSPVQLDARFGREAGFKSNLSHALKDFLETEKSEPSDYSAVILNSVYARAASGLFVKAGFDAEKQFFMDSIQPQIGYTRACHALLYLIDCLENNSGNILFIDYGNGTNIFRIEQTVTTPEKGNVIQAQIENGASVESYQDYLLLEKAGNVDSKAPKLDILASDMMLEREKESLIHLKGFECTKCKTVYFIKSHRCNNCGEEEFTLKRLAKTGTIFTFTKEHYFPTSFPPVTMAVVDLDGGGRVTVQVTDQMYQQQMPEGLVGSKVELVLRKMIENDVKPNYFWKCRFLK